MKLWSLILLFGVCSRCTTAEEVTIKNYVANVDKKTLSSLTLIGSEQPTIIELLDLHIQHIKENVFDNFTYITMLNIAKNKISELSPRVFSKLTKLTGLSLANNYLSDVRQLFVGLNRLELLDLSGNPIRKLNIGDLFGLPKFTSVLTIGNGLEYLSSKVFKNSFDDALPFEPEDETYEEYADEPIGSAVPLPDAYGVKICKTFEGIMESVEYWGNDEELGVCFRAHINRKERIIESSFQALTKFRSNWYKLPRFAINKIDLSNNNIDEITPELLNDLPESLIAVDLSSNLITIIRRNVIVNSHIHTLTLDSNAIEIIEDDAFEGTNITTLRLKANLLKNLDFVKTLPRSIKGLDVSYNDISKISLDTFLKLDKLQMIDLSFNFLETLETGTFQNQKNLRELRLIFNNLTYLSSGPFKELKRLELLDISHNRIENISQSTFSGLQNSQDLKIYLSDNQINVIGVESFSNFKLSVLDLSSNRIDHQSIEKGAFNGCRVRKLILSHNFIKKINSECFKGILGSYILNLGNNQISTIENGDAEYLTNVRKLILDYNPLQDLNNGALHGLSTDKEVGISLKGAPIVLIHGGLFDNNPLYYTIV